MVVSQNTDVVQMKRAHLTQYAIATLNRVLVTLCPQDYTRDINAN